MKDGALDADVGYRLDLPQLADYARTLAPEAMARLESVTGALQGRTKLALRGADYRVGVSVDKSDAALQIKALEAKLATVKKEIATRQSAWEQDLHARLLQA